MGAQGIGSILPPDSLPPVASLAGEFEVVIEHIDPSGSGDVLARCRYPDGFIKHHQCAGVLDLLPKIISQIRARYGTEEVNIVEVPQALDAGSVIRMETADGE